MTLDELILALAMEDMINAPKKKDKIIHPAQQFTAAKKKGIRY